MSSNPQQGFDIDAWLEAISDQESGGNYGIQRLDKHGATGKYQVIKENIPKWTKELYGVEFTPEEFASDPEAQEEVARFKFNQYYQQRGGNLAEVAKDWYGRGKTKPGHPTPDQYAKSILSKYEAARARRASQPQGQPVTQKSLDEMTDEEVAALTQEQLDAFASQAQAQAQPAQPPATTGTEGQTSPDGKFKWSNGRWVDNTGALPSQLNPAGVDQQQLVVDPNNPNQTQQPPADSDWRPPGTGYGTEGFVKPTMDYLNPQQPAGSGVEAEQRAKLREAAAHYKKRNLMVPHSGQLTLQQANDSLAQFVFGGSAEQARQRQAAAIKAGLLDQPLSVLADDFGAALSNEDQFREIVAKRSKAHPGAPGHYSLPIIVDELSVALRERFNKEAGPDPDAYAAWQQETDPALRDIRKANLDRAKREQANLAPFEQLVASRLSHTGLDAPTDPAERRAFIREKAKELQADTPLANDILNFFGAGYDYKGNDPRSRNKYMDALEANVGAGTGLGPEMVAISRIFNPLTPLLAAGGDEESQAMYRDGLQGVAAFFNGLSMGALSDYDPRYDEAYNQLTPEQKARFDSKFKLARIAPQSAGTTAAIALLVAAPGGLAGAAGATAKGLGFVEGAANIARGARAANWISKTIQASGFNGTGIGSSIAQASLYSVIDEAVKTGAPSLDEWARGGGWDESASAAENVANYVGRVVKRLPDDAAQFIIGNQWGRVAEKLAADYGLKTLGREVAGRVGESAGETVQEVGSQIYQGRLDLSDAEQTKALLTAGMLGFLMGNGGSHAPIIIKSNAGHTYQLNAGGGLDLVNDMALSPDAVVIPEGAVIGNAGMGIDDFYRAVGGQAAADQQKIDIAEQSAVESGEMQGTVGESAVAGLAPPVVPQGVNTADITTNLAEYHRDYQSRAAAGEEAPTTIFGGDEGVRSAAAGAADVEYQLREDPERYIAEQEGDAEALATLAKTARQLYEGKKGPDSVLGLEGETVAPVTDPEELKGAFDEAVKQAASSPDGSIDPVRAIKLKDVLDSIRQEYGSNKDSFLKALDAAAATQQATAKSIRDEFGSKAGQERRFDAELADATAAENRVGAELQVLNDEQQRRNEERRATRDAVRDAEDYVLVAKDGVIEAENRVAEAEAAAEQAKAPLARALEMGGVTAAQMRVLNRKVEQANARVEQAKQGVAKAQQVVQRAEHAAKRASAADSRKLEDLQDFTEQFGTKQKEFKAAQDRVSRAYANKEAFIKEQKKAAAEKGKTPDTAAKPAPASAKPATAANKPVTAERATKTPEGQQEPAKPDAGKANYAGPEAVSSAEISSQKPAVRAEYLSKPENVAVLADRALGILEESKARNDINKGSSVYIDGTEPTSGYAVSLDMEHVVQGDPETEMAQYVARADVKEALAAKPNRVVGTWVDDSGNTYFDVSEVVENEGEAIEMGEINGQFGYFDIGKKATDPENAYQPLPFGEAKRTIADHYMKVVGPATGEFISRQEAMDRAQVLTSLVSIIAKDKGVSLPEAMDIALDGGLLGVKGYSTINVGGTEIPAHINEDGSIVLAQRTILPKDFVNLYVTPVTAPPEGKKKVDNPKIAEALNAMVGNKILPFEVVVKGETPDQRRERFAAWKAKVVQRFTESWMVDIKDALDAAAATPEKFKLKGFNDSNTIKAGKQKDPTKKDVLALLDRGLNWYDTGKKEAIANVAKHRPELRLGADGRPVDPFAYTAFATILGAHSPGNMPMHNGPQAIEHYVDWQAQRDAAKDPDLVLLPLVNTAAFANVEQVFEVDGKPVKVKLMVPGASYSRAGHNPVIAINKLAQLKFDGNIKEAIEWLHALHPRSEVFDVARQMKGGTIELPRKDMIPGSFILDTKIGAFISNLGGNFDFVTIDLWEGTGHNRHMGTVGGDGLARNEWEADAMQASVEALGVELEKRWRGRDKLGKQLREAFGPPRALKPAETQGLIWYIEQQIWAAHGHTGVESVSYEESTKEYSDNWEENKARREQGRKDVEAAWLSDLYATTSPAREALAGRRLTEDKKTGRVDPAVTFGASPDLQANAATVQFLIDSLAHLKARPKLVVSQVSEGESVAWGNIPRDSWIVMRQGDVTPYSVHQTKKEAEAAAQQLKDYRGEFQQGAARLAGLEAQRDFLITQIQTRTNRSREDIEKDIAQEAALHAALLPVRTILYQETSPQLAYEGRESDEKELARLPVGSPRYEEILKRRQLLGNPRFREWFGDSVVVNNFGHPEVVYHFTKGDFDAFDPDMSKDIGFHFGTAGQANKRGEEMTGNRGWRREAGMGENVMPVYLSIRNPLYVKDVFSTQYLSFPGKLAALKKAGLKIDAELEGEAKLLQDAYDRLESFEGLEKKFWRLIKPAMKAQGFDGFVYKNTEEGKGDSYATLEPTQIKSAIGNTGAFDPTNPSILRQLSPGELRTEIQRIASIGGTPSTDALVTILAAKPEYLSGVASYLIKQRSKLLAGKMTARDVAKAYIITMSSMGATEQIPANKDKQSTALGLDPAMQTGADIGNIPAGDFLSSKNGESRIRPEDFMAKFFFTKDGQALLDHIEQVAEGKVELDERFFEPMTKVREGFGNYITTTNRTFEKPKAGSYTLHNVADFVKELNKAGKTGNPEAILDVVTKLKGIGEGKKGFIGQLLGFGGAATVDAVEINTWLLGKGSVTKGSPEVALTKFASTKSMAPVMRRLVEGGMQTIAMDPRIANQLSAAEVDPNAFQTIMHHWLWDRMKGTETSHAGLYKAMEFAQPGRAGRVLGMTGYAGINPAVMGFYVGANTSTYMHEPVHVYRRFMPKADLEIASKWVVKVTGKKIYNGEWLPVHDEALARGFEQWLLEGKMPANAPEGLLGVFERLQAAIVAVYQDAEHYKATGKVDDFSGRLDDNIAGVFERMLGLKTKAGTPSQQAALDSYKRRAEQGREHSERRYATPQPADEAFARDMMLSYCRWDFRRMPIADQRGLLEEIFEVQRDGVSPRTKEEVLGPVFAGRVGEFRDSKVPAMGQAALQRRMAKRLDDATQMSPQFDSDARQILEIYRFGQHAFNALYPNKSVAKRLPSFTLYLAHYHPQMLLNVVRSRAKLAGTDIFSDKWLAKEQTLRQLVRDSLYTPTFVNVTFNQSNQGGVELYQRNVPANPEAEAALQKVRDYFGTTDNIKEVGMLAPDGSGLALFKDGWDMHANKLVKAGVDDLSLLDFITETGAARISSDGYYLNVEAGAPLTRAQVEYLEDHAYSHRETRVDLHKIVEGEWPSFEHVAVEQDEANRLLGKLRRAEREAFGHKEGYTTLYQANRTKKAEAEELLAIAVREMADGSDDIGKGFLTPDATMLPAAYGTHGASLREAGLPSTFVNDTGSLRITDDYDGSYTVEATAPLTPQQAKWLVKHSDHYEINLYLEVGGRYNRATLTSEDSDGKRLGLIRKMEKNVLGDDYTSLFMASGQPATPQQANAAAIAAAAQQVAAAFNALDQASWQEIVADIRKAGMLSGLRTHLGNVISNTAFQIVEEAARYPAVAADMLMRLRYGQRSITASQVDNIKSIIHAFSLADTPNIGGSADPESLEKARKAGLRRFTDELFGVTSNTANTQTSSNDHGWNRDNKAVVAIEKITNAVFKTLQAEDAVFHSYAMRRHLLDLARVAVKNGEAASQADFLANLTEADIDQANADALIATFNNNNALSTGISNLKSSLSEHGGLGAYSKLAVELIVPFDRTPTNIIGRMFDYTPLGMILGSGGRHEREMVLSSGDYVPSSIISKIKALEGLRRERLLGAANISDRDIRVLQREATKQLGRGSVGTIILIGAALGRLGTIMGLGDDDDWDRNEATGAQKGSMLIGGRWVSLNRMQPIGSLLVLGATIQQSLQRESTGGGVASDTAMAALKQLMQIPSLRGFTDFGKATDDENKLESFTGRMIASFIPTVIKDIADAGDSLQRDTKDQSVNVGGLFSVPVGPAMAAIPGLRETLPAKKDFLGRDLPETHWAQAFFDPFNTSPSRSSGIDKASIGKEAKDDPVFKELDRLDVNITKPKRLAGESEEDYVQRLRVTGTAAYRAVEKQIATQAYKDAAGLRAKSGKVKQKEWLEDRIEDAKREATSKLKKWAEAQGKQPKVAEPEFPWEIEAAEKKANKMPSRPSIKSIMKDTPEKPEGFDQ